MGRRHEVLVPQRGEAAAHLAAERRPADDREDDGDREVDPKRRPGERDRRGQAHPERDVGDRSQELDHALDDVIDRAPVVAGDASEQDPQDDRQRDSDKANRHRGARTKHQP